MADGKARGKPCKGCGSTTRPVPHPGPRCATCQRVWRKRNARLRRLARVAAVYSLTPEQYAALEDACPRNPKGEPLCSVCRRYRARAVDHDHSCCKGSTSCGRCVRGLLCGTCNTMLGRQGDKVETFERATEYLRNPPARLIMTIDEAAHKIGAEYGEALRALARFDSEGESNGNPASESE